jgi:fatty-acyl-CoA synthase
MVGAKLVLPGPKAGDPAALTDLIDAERVTVALGVPTVWLGLLQYLEQTGRRLDSLERTLVGGAACPSAVMEAFRTRHGVETRHGWGMTEMSPLGTVNTPSHAHASLPDDELCAVRAKQGRAVFGVEMEIMDDEDRPLPHDGVTSGRLKVRGAWVAAAYYRDDSCAHQWRDGWFDTGDVGTIDADGFLRITDRAKDVIKSGGEWISSIEVENAAMDYPGVAEAAVIGVPHPKWTERPLLVVVAKPGETPDAQALRAFLETRIAKWWVPDEVVFVDAIPHTATGKVSKRELRERFAERARGGAAGA